MFYIYFPCPFTTKKPQPLQKSHGSLGYMASLKVLQYACQNRKRMAAGIFSYLGVFCLGTYAKSWHLTQVILISCQQSTSLHHMCFNPIDIKSFQALSLKLASQIHFCYVMHYIMPSFESPWYLLLYLCILSPSLLSCGSLAGTAMW